MKLFALLVLVASLAWASLCDAAESGVEASQILIEVRALAVPAAAAVELMPRLTGGADISPLVAELDRLVLQQKAELVDTAVMFAQSGITTSSETLEEFRYPCEFDPPQVPSIFGHGPVGKFEPPFQKEPRWGAIVPTAFETRNTGYTFTVLPSLRDDGSTIHLAVTVSFLRFTGFREFTGARSPHQITGTTKQPYFEKQELTTSYSARSGSARLLGSFVDQKQRFIVVTIRATNTPLKP